MYECYSLASSTIPFLSVNVLHRYKPSSHKLQHPIQLVLLDKEDESSVVEGMSALYSLSTNTPVSDSLILVPICFLIQANVLHECIPSPFIGQKDWLLL